MVEVPFTCVCPFCDQEHTDTVEVPIEEYVDVESEGRGPPADRGPPTNGDGNPLCTGMEDGQCSRTVDELGGTCWQHQKND